jgi:RNA polymerase sigma-70 factor (ECF subfamily)
MMLEAAGTMCSVALLPPRLAHDECQASHNLPLETAGFQFVLPSLVSVRIVDLSFELKQELTFSKIPAQASPERRGGWRETNMRTFHQVALEHLDGLFGYAMTLTRNESEAEDLVQETYLRATRACDRLAPDSHVKSWLFTILRNSFLNQIRHRRAGPAMVELDDEAGAPLPIPDQGAANPLDSFLTEEKQRDVWQAIESLPDSFREVIVLREFQDLSYQEIAKVLDCPVGTVMSRLGRAREKLRLMLQHWDKEGKASVSGRRTN